MDDDKILDAVTFTVAALLCVVAMLIGSSCGPWSYHEPGPANGALDAVIGEHVFTGAAYAFSDEKPGMTGIQIAQDGDSYGFVRFRSALRPLDEFSLGSHAVEPVEGLAPDDVLMVCAGDAADDISFDEQVSGIVTFTAIEGGRHINITATTSRGEPVSASMDYFR
jgi:hypothetical protein